MSDINSTTPLGTEATLGVSTSSDAALTVLSFAANGWDGFFIGIPSGSAGYWKTSQMSAWAPIPTAGLNATLPCNGSGAFTLQVKRVPSGSNVTDIRAARIPLAVSRQ